MGTLGMALLSWIVGWLYSRLPASVGGAFTLGPEGHHVGPGEPRYPRGRTGAYNPVMTVSSGKHTTRVGEGGHLWG